MGPILATIITTLIAKGLPKIVENVLSNKKGGLKNVKKKLSLPENMSDEGLNKHLNELSEAELELLVDYEHSLVVESEVTKRLEIDNNADSWFTRHVRPIMLVSLSLFYILFSVLAVFALKDPVARDSAEVFGNQMFMLLVPVYGFYFGGRSFEKIFKIKRDL